jgi:hypothetical protein
VTLTAPDLALVRDEVGTATPPTDAELQEASVELGHWRLVALRVLKRRRAEYMIPSTSESSPGGAVTSIAVPGALSVGFAAPTAGGSGSITAALAALDRQIARLEGEHAAEFPDEAVTLGEVTSTRLYRPGMR